MDIIERFQNNLLLIRRAAGWTAEEFGNKIGVTRQTINNLERKGTAITMNKTVYIAMRAVLEDEIRNNPDDTQMLNDILEIFVDHPNQYEESKRQELLSKANMIAPSILAKNSEVTRKDASIMWSESITTMLLGAAAVAALAISKKKNEDAMEWLNPFKNID